MKSSINSDGSVSADLTGVAPRLTAKHDTDAWGRRQVTLTVVNHVMGGRPHLAPLSETAHLKVNAHVLREWAAALTEIAAEAERLYALEGERVPAGAHGGGQEV